MSRPDFEARVAELGLELPDYGKRPYYGADYGSMKPHHITGNLLFLGGHTADDDQGNVRLPGRLGQDLSIEEGYAAARYTALNCLGGIRYALGSLDRVTAVVRSLCFVVTTPDFEDVHKVSSGATDVFRDVFGPEVGLGGRATIGVMSLARRSCFEAWVTVEIDD
ncbi:RidA family protein [Streptomyces sp. SID3343]|uniref:RidA family protein n=1 Tax=Streptomyces sp. SID3343 TaxID=2690260 RepID=UPI0013696E8F|nr:RidA family protein [Streptomyces sp. SID3343]MYW05034.1 RidA family protein [Streptomyces sp. SID3343]